MELNRLVRVVRARWPIVAVISLVGFVSAFGGTALVNSELTPLFEAVISIEFELEGEETVDDLADEIEGERRLAAFAAQDLLAEYSGSSIIADTGLARLVFVARGDSREQARSRVRELADAYLESDPRSGGDINEQLAELERQADEIAAEIATFQPSLSPAEEALQNQHELLDLQIQRLRQEIVALTVADAGATEEQKAANASAKEDLEESLQELQDEKAALPPPPSEELTPVEQLRLDALQRRKDILNLDYQRLALRTMGVTAEGSVQPVTVNDLTPEPSNPFMNGAIGLLSGIGVGLLALSLTVRVRREIWLPSDLPIPLLAVIPRREVSDLPSFSWYDATEGSKRKESIQALRTAIEGSFDEPTSALAVVGDQVDPVECQTLGVDIAASFASAGRTVLVVDADYSTENRLNELKVGEPTLESVLRLHAGSPESLGQHTSALLDEAIQIRPGLSVVPSGAPPSSPADALAGPQFRLFLEQAKSTFDLVIVVAGATRSPTAQVMIQRTGGALLAVAPGKTTIPSVQALVSDLHTQRVNPVGAVLISGAEPRASVGSPSLPSWLRPLRSLLRRPEDATAGYSGVSESPVGRLRFYPSPMEKGSGQARNSPLQTLVGDLSEARSADEDDYLFKSEEEADEFAAEVLAALAGASKTAYEPVAEYVVARVEDVLTAVSGQENLSDELVEVVLQDGFIPLTGVRDHRTVGEWLVEELRWELGSELGDKVAAEFVRLLVPDGQGTAESLDSWLAQEFFRRHLERTQGEPEVWHLTSEAGTVQVLVYGRRLNRDRLNRLSSDIVRRRIDELQRQLREATEADDLDEVRAIEMKLRDLHLFEVALGMLQVGSSDEAKVTYPWRRYDQQPRGWVPVWTEGIRPNLAPLQRLGLLAHPVLTEEELVSNQSPV